MHWSAPDVLLACLIPGGLFIVMFSCSFSILWAVNWRPWRLYSWMFVRKWPGVLKRYQLDLLCGLLSLSAWLIVISPILLLILWGCWLTFILSHDIIGLAIIMAGNALLLMVYAVMLWWRTQWQSSRAVAILLILSVILLCAYELCALYITTVSSASEQYSPSGYFFGVSAIALAINMLFICKMVFTGNDFDLDEYVRRAYKYAYSNHVDTGPVAGLREPPDPSGLYPRQTTRVSHLALLYTGSLFILVTYSILYGLTAKDAHWLAAITSVAVIILDWNMGACLYRFQLLKNRFTALLVAGISRLLLICFGVQYWYLGHCLSYAIVSSVLIGATVNRHMPICEPLAARRDALRSTVTRLREGYRKKDVSGSSSSFDGCGSSGKQSSSIDAGQLGNINEPNVGNEHFSGNVGGGNNKLNDMHTCERYSIDRSIDGERPELLLHNTYSTVQGSNPTSTTNTGGSPCGIGALEPVVSVHQRVVNLNIDHALQEILNGSRVSSEQKTRANTNSCELTSHELISLSEDKLLDPNFKIMLKEKSLDSTATALLHKNGLDEGKYHFEIDSEISSVLPNQISLSEQQRFRLLEKWLQLILRLLKHAVGTIERTWVLFSAIFIIETLLLAIFHPKMVKLLYTTHHQFEFGCAVLLLSPVICSILAFRRSLQAEEMVMTSRPCKFGVVAWLMSTCMGLLLSFMSKSSIILGLSITFPLMVACFAVAVPIWIHNGYRFWISRANCSPHTGNYSTGMKQAVLFICVVVFIGSVLSLGAIISANPLNNINYRRWNYGQENIQSPYESLSFLGWTVAATVALIVTGTLPVVSWFSTYRFSLSSAICLGTFAVVVVAFSGASYVEVVRSRDGEIPTRGDFLGALLPLLCIPAMLSLCCGLYKWKDDDWVLTRGAHLFLIIVLLLLLGAITAVTVIIKPWMIGVGLLLILLLAVLAVGVICCWASNNCFLSRMHTICISFLIFLLAFAAYLVGWFGGKPFIGASIGYFSVLFLLAGRAVTTLLSPPMVIYSPRVLPVYVYDAHADSIKNVSSAFLTLCGIAMATEVWGVVASLKTCLSFTGTAVLAITLVLAFGFTVSRPCLTLEMVEDAIYFLSKETIVQAIARTATKTRNAFSGAYLSSQGSSSCVASPLGGSAVMIDACEKIILPRADVKELRDQLKVEEMAGKSLIWSVRNEKALQGESGDHKREMCAHARILTLEEAIDMGWVYMWDKFGGYLLLLLGLTATAERVQDEMRLRLFLDSIGLSNLNAKKIRSWTAEERQQFDMIQESYLKEKGLEEELLIQRREEEGRGKERRKILLEKEERKWKEMEASVMSTIPNIGSRDAATIASAVRAIGGDSSIGDAGTRERITGVAWRMRRTQLARRAIQTGIPGAVCLLDDEPTRSGRHLGEIDPCVCSSQKVSLSVTVLVQHDSGPACLIGCGYQSNVCWEIFVAGSEQGIEAGQVGLRLISISGRQSVIAKEWTVGSTNVADGRWHVVSMTIDTGISEATCYLDGGYDGCQTELQLHGPTSIWEVGTEAWIGERPLMDVDGFVKSDHDGVECRFYIMDTFLWGKCLSEDDISALYGAVKPAEDFFNEMQQDCWQWTNSPSRVDDSVSDDAELDICGRDNIDLDAQSYCRRRKSTCDGVAIDISAISCLIRKNRTESREEINQRMLSVEMAIRELLSARGENCFTDQEFPPSEQSLFLNPGNPPTKLQVVAKWMRPVEMVRENNAASQPCLFTGSANPSDVCQGRLGDCWFLSAVAVLSQASRISEVIITPQYNEEGIYTIRFCIQGEWVPVVVDDWIPCESAGKPAFACSKKANEIWVSILEKAYAKLHGSYQALEGGLVQDALVDLTGGAGEEIDIRSTQAQIDLASGRLWSQLLRFKQEGFLLGAGSPSGSDVRVSSSGIVQGHAYSILQVREVDGHKLVQVHNPWASEVEWNGPWSDTSAEWTDRLRHKLKFVPQSKNGVFWMSWLDFQMHFRSIYVCRVYPPEMRYSVHGQWRGYSAGGCQDYESWNQNPQFQLRANGADASTSIHVFITLTQGVNFSKTSAGFRNYHSGHDSMMFFIGMRILKTRGRRAANDIYLHESVGGTDYVNSREISCEIVLEPDPRGYTIVPTTIFPGEEAPFVLSVFTKASIVLEPL